MQFQLQPTDPEAAAIIQESLSLFKQSLQLYKLNDNQLITMRMVNAAVYGFITLEQAGLMTLGRSIDTSYDVMLSALIVAIEHTRYGSI